jgi:hypothetical protein
MDSRAVDERKGRKSKVWMRLKDIEQPTTARLTVAHQTPYHHRGESDGRKRGGEVYSIFS